MLFCLSPKYLLNNPFVFLLVLAFFATFTIIYITDGGFGEPQPQEIYSGFSLSSLLNLQDSPEPPEDDGTINWKSDYAYVQYATSQDYLCSAIMIFDQLEALKTRAARVLIYPKAWGVPGEPEPVVAFDQKVVPKNKKTTELLQLARDTYGVRLQPVSELQFMSVEKTWKSSFTKLLAFNETDYKRVIVMDSDAYVLQSLDYLFLHERAVANSPLSAPYAYWEPKNPKNSYPFLTSGFMLIDPSTKEYERVLAASQVRHIQDYDMDVINDVYGGKMDPLPHYSLAMLTAEFRQTDHSPYIGLHRLWDGKHELQSIAYLHFSDWPFPKVSIGQSTIVSYL